MILLAAPCSLLWCCGGSAAILLLLLVEFPLTATGVPQVADVYRWQRWHRGKICRSSGCPFWFGCAYLLWPPVCCLGSFLCRLTVRYHKVDALVWSACGKKIQDFHSTKVHFSQSKCLRFKKRNYPKNVSAGED